MALSGNRLGDAMKAAVDALLLPIDRTNLFRGQGNAIVNEIGANGFTTPMVAGVSLSAGQFVYVSAADGRLYPALASTAATMPAVGVVPNAITPGGATGDVQIGGLYATSGLTPGAVYYISPAVAGALTPVYPTVLGQFAQVVGVALSSTLLLLAPGTPALPAQSISIINAAISGTATIGAGAITAATLNHLIGGGSAPSIAAGAGAGTGPTIAISGTDVSGVITLTTGTTPTTPATIATITFATAFAAAPKGVILTPSNAAAAALAAASPYVDDSATSTSQFLLKSQGAGLAATTAYRWAFGVIA
jgi:hypothetical protein